MKTDAAPARFDAAEVRARFPALRQEVHGRPLVYLDTAASAQKPQEVLDAERRFLERDYANVHRGLHALGERATAGYEGARAALARFVGAADPSEIVFTGGTTGALNLVARSWAAPRLAPGDEIVLTELEHHSNLVPWQLVAEERGARLVPVPIDARGALDLDAARRLVGPRTKVVACGAISNALGTVNPVAELAELAHAAGAVLVVDAAQAAAHDTIDVAAWGCDFLALSAHKMYGPSGIGALWGRKELLADMPPWLGGGEMIRSVSFERTTYADPPHRFEAGTPPISQAVGFAAAAAFLEGLDRAAAFRHEAALLAEAEARVAAVPGVRILSRAPRRRAILSFVVDGVHPHDVGQGLDAEGVAVRVGHHCAEPLMRRLDVPATVRASFGVYNEAADVDAFARALARVVAFFR